MLKAHPSQPTDPEERGPASHVYDRIRPREAHRSPFAGQQIMRTLWRDHPWLDLAAAVVLALVVFNVHVSTTGDALSSLGRAERRGFYAVVAVLAVIMLAATFARNSRIARWCRGCLGFAVASGLAAMLLDVQDGPVRTVQLALLLGLFLGAMASVRFIAYSDGEPALRADIAGVL